MFKKLYPSFCQNESEEPITEKQIGYVLEVERRKGILLKEEEIKEWSKTQASKWITENK